MSKLIDVYSRSCGLEIDEPFLQEKFYPLDEKLYFTIQGSSGQESKCYDYFAEVLEIIAPFLAANKITVIQLGGKEDKPIGGCKHLMGATSLTQSYYILRRSMLHIGNDSWLAHAAGALKIPLVSLYGSTSSWNHGPYFYDKNKTFLIDSHRWKNVPTYSVENKKTINLIKPEEVANSILKIFGIQETIPQDTILMGAGYKDVVVEHVPNFILAPNFFEGRSVNIRMDYHFDENNLANTIATGRKVNIFTNKPINPALLSHFKPNISGIFYEISMEDSPEYVKEIKKLGIQIKFFTKNDSEEYVSDLRAKFFDVHNAIEKITFPTKQNYLEDAASYCDTTIESLAEASSLFYRSNKLLLSNGQIFISKAAWMQEKPIPSVERNVQQVIDIPEFWEDYQHFRIFKNLSNAPQNNT
jgi:hypothetical protein